MFVVDSFESMLFNSFLAIASIAIALWLMFFIYKRNQYDLTTKTKKIKVLLLCIIPPGFFMYIGVSFFTQFLPQAEYINITENPSARSVIENSYEMVLPEKIEGEVILVRKGTWDSRTHYLLFEISKEEWSAFGGKMSNEKLDDSNDNMMIKINSSMPYGYEVQQSKNSEDNLIIKATSFNSPTTEYLWLIVDANYFKYVKSLSKYSSLN